MHIEHPHYTDGSPILLGEMIMSTGTGRTGMVAGFDYEDNTISMLNKQSGEHAWVAARLVARLDDRSTEREIIETVLKRMNRDVRAEIDDLRERFPRWLIAAGVSWAVDPRSET
jgi:hypothetical protein